MDAEGHKGDLLASVKRGRRVSRVEEVQGAKIVQRADGHNRDKDEPENCSEHREIPAHRFEQAVEDERYTGVARERYHHPCRCRRRCTGWSYDEDHQVHNTGDPGLEARRCSRGRVPHFQPPVVPLPDPGDAECHSTQELTDRPTSVRTRVLLRQLENPNRRAMVRWILNFRHEHRISSRDRATASADHFPRTDSPGAELIADVRRFGYRCFSKKTMANRKAASALDP